MANNLKLFLGFGSNYPNTLPITEVFLFDGFSFTILQDAGRFGRDVNGDEEITLRFEKGLFEPTDTPLTLPNGNKEYNLTMGYEWLAEFDKRYGFEAKVYFIIQKDNVDFVVGLLDFQTRKTDGRTYYEFKIIQETERMKINRLMETNIDLFSNRDLKGNSIQPLIPENFLLQAKPFTGLSAWKSIDTDAGCVANVSRSHIGSVDVTSTVCTGANNSMVVLNYGIENTLSYISETYAISNIDGDIADENFCYVQLKEDASNVTIKITDLDASVFQSMIDIDGIITAASGRVRLVVRVGLDVDHTLNEYVLYNKDFGFVSNTPIEQLPTSFILNIPFIPRDHRIYIYLQPRADVSFSGTSPLFTSTYVVAGNWINANIEINLTEIAIDSVVVGVRYIDVFKQALKSINGFEVLAKAFDVGGVFHNNMAVNGYLIRQITDKGFNVQLKDLVKGLIEFCADYQILKDGFFIGEYKNFYPNIEIASFDSIPEAATFEPFYNERYCVGGIDIKYNDYEQNRDEKNTNNAIHTETQYKTPNDSVEGKLDLTINHRRDYCGIESDRRQGIDTKATTSLAGDDRLTLIDIIELAPNTMADDGAYLNMRISGGKVQILNNNSLGEGISINWTKIGMTIGAFFEITFGRNVGTYTIFSIEPTVLTLTPTFPATQSFSGDAFINWKFYYTNVFLKNRTNEGFDRIENIQDGDKLSNLNYTPRDIEKQWASYIHTACKYTESGTILNTFFKNEKKNPDGSKQPNLLTQFEGGTVYIQNEDILVSSLDAPIVTATKYRLKIQASFTEVLDLCDAMERVTIDGDIGGFVRAKDTNGKIIKGYISKLNYTWVSEELILELEEKAEPFITTIDAGTGIYKVFINEVGYTQANLLAIGWFEINHNYLIIFDNKYMSIINPVLFTNVTINGQVYTDKILFTNAMNSLT